MNLCGQHAAQTIFVLLDGRRESRRHGCGCWMAGVRGALHLQVYRDPKPRCTVIKFEAGDLGAC